MCFEKIYIELSDLCGLKCSFCPSVKGVRGAMSLDDFKIIASKLAKKSRIYAFHLLGDPLILPNLAEFIEVAKAHKMPLELTTSGFYMSKENQALLLKSKNLRQINFSLISFLDQKRIKFWDYFDPLLSFLHSYVESKNQGFVNLRLWNLKADLIFSSQNEPIYSLLEDRFKIKINRSAVKNRLANRLILHQARRFSWANSSKDFLKDAHNKPLNSKQSNIFKKSCHGLKKQIGILSNGTVVPCCMDTRGEIALGNLLKQELNEILNTPRAQAMKRGFERGEFVERLCRGCEFGPSKTSLKGLN
ncbi:radical SAM/SPASM domain-containing protein [Campylobacter troglodytis]|uniref:radical SAM/SPASM domain-containing protein n=1 Tax=Campylobacter troglodytis TaxID=654363 RepID=UPI001159F55E|nr:radical SAM/SPASM domain-containing protein [Campylobacter troglodytis]TQR60679.1 radical SAM protein [Campylobacter troglodytis]